MDEECAWKSFAGIRSVDSHSCVHLRLHPLPLNFVSFPYSVPLIIKITIHHCRRAQSGVSLRILVWILYVVELYVGYDIKRWHGLLVCTLVASNRRREIFHLWVGRAHVWNRPSWCSVSSTQRVSKILILFISSTQHTILSAIYLHVIIKMGLDYMSHFFLSRFARMIYLIALH